jgi:hypothetical protein
VSAARGLLLDFGSFAGEAARLIEIPMREQSDLA